MTKEFDEQKLRFTFDNAWLVEQYDQHVDYREKIEKLDHTKAVDFVGIRRTGHSQSVYLIEVKDYRQSSSGPPRDVELAREVALKVRDTLAGLIGAHRMSHEPEAWRSIVKALAHARVPIKIVLWLEESLPPRPLARRRNAAQVLGNELKKQCRWLTNYLVVSSLDVGEEPHGVHATSLPFRNPS